MILYYQILVRKLVKNIQILLCLGEEVVNLREVSRVELHLSWSKTAIYRLLSLYLIIVLTLKN